MSVMINVQPGSGTVVRFVQNSVEPPTLVIYDGTATVFFCPAAVQGALLDARTFAQGLTRVAAQWEQGCRRAIEATQMVDPLRVGELAERHRDQGSG